MAAQDSHQQAIANRLLEYRPLRAQRYATVNVLLITWSDHDLGLGFDQEVAELREMFCQTFNYNVWPYMIPSKDAERSLNAVVAQFTKNFGGEDGLLIIFYSGHGGPGTDTKTRSPCTWAAKICGEPTLDWSNIQPQLFLASGDVAIILDCCYAGQAARSRTSHRVEFLAATDKDNWTPTGMQKWPSFTKVLMQQMEFAMSTQGLVTLAALQSRMVIAEAGLKRQPLLVSLAGNASEGPIKLTKLPSDSNSTESTPTSISRSINSIYLRLYLFDPLDGTTSPSLLRWLTRDSPASVEDIQLLDQVMSQAQDINKMGTEVFEAAIEQERTQMLPFLSREGQVEVQRLLSELRLAVCASGDALSATPEMAKTILHNLRMASSRLMDFVKDSLATMDRSTLSTLDDSNAVILEDIKNKIAMRLILLDDTDMSGSPTRVSFRDMASPGQRIRFGKQADNDVLVEYIYYDAEDPGASDRLPNQIKRVIALLSESKNPAFRCFGSSGFSQETLCGPRFGLIHPLPKDLTGRKCMFLADLIGRIKYVPLNRRMRLTGVICNAILHLHSIGWYYKNIKCDNVVVFGPPDGGDDGYIAENWDFEKPFLIGFDCSRPVDAETRDTVDFTTKNNIYRHPDRWGRSTRFEKHHDLYSLGILMMEIGCWTTLPSLDSKRSNFDHVCNPEALRSLLLKVVSSKLAHAAGTRYAEAVRICLEKRRWKDLEDWESQKIVREKVLGPLMDCSGAAG
ncbi:hypothetical protein FDECE_1542 [Fusarium decemcellulare]|nr:hypothetical protein FDECE_1542 [Fusarium decemcellulare]